MIASRLTVVVEKTIILLKREREREREIKCVCVCACIERKPTPKITVI